MNNQTMGWIISVSLLVGLVVARSIFIARTDKNKLNRSK